MTYVISDLHGYPHERFMKLLEKAGFSDRDFLYILGDVVDRRLSGGSCIRIMYSLSLETMRQCY